MKTMKTKKVKAIEEANRNDDAFIRIAQFTVYKFLVSIQIMSMEEENICAAHFPHFLYHISVFGKCTIIIK